MTEMAGFTTAGPHAAAQILQPSGGTIPAAAAAATSSGCGPKTLAVSVAGAGATAAGAAGTTAGTTGPASCNLQQPTTTTTTTTTTAASTAAARTKLPHLPAATTSATNTTSPSAADRGIVISRNDAAVDSDNVNSDDAPARRTSASLKHPHRPAYLRLRDNRPPAASSRSAQNGPIQDSEAAPHLQQHSGPRHQQPSLDHSLPVSPVSPPRHPAGPTTSSPTDQGAVYAEPETNDDQGERHSPATKEGSYLVQEQRSAPSFAAAGSRDTPGQSSSPSRISTGQTSATTSRPTSTDDSSASPASVGRPSRSSRPSSFSDAHTTAAVAVDDSQTSTRPPARRAPASRSSHGVPTSAGPPPSLDTQRRHAADFASQPSPGGSTTSPSDIQGPRELLLPKRLSQSSSSDESRHSTSNRPPISYKPPTNTTAAPSGTSTPVRVPPIRGFRSSGSRKSLALDMNFRPRPYDLGDDSARGTIDNTLRALEGRYSDDSRRSSTLSPGRQNSSPGNFDDTGDIFLRIARDEPSHRPGDESVPDDVQSSVVSLPQVSLDSALHTCFISNFGCHVVRACCDKNARPPPYPTAYFTCHWRNDATKATHVSACLRRIGPSSFHLGYITVLTREAVPRSPFGASSATLDRCRLVSDYVTPAPAPPSFRPARPAPDEERRRGADRRGIAGRDVSESDERKGSIGSSR